jgi:uncharacterized membrane protein
MDTPASIKHHPYHPVLVGLPIGLWVFSLFSDFMAYFKWGSQVWNSVAYFTLAGGIVTALIAAVPGFIDLLSITDKRLRQIGVIHMLINLVVVGLYVVNLLLRRDGQSALVPFVLSGVGIILLGISGWLGGELVHHYGVGVADQTGPASAHPA